jgi:lysylphosphatidylglycerol synthetase-like protein (DUF2156 family)
MFNSDAINNDTISENSLSRQERQALISQYGRQSSAYFTLQEDVHHFGTPELGFTSYYVQRFLGKPYNIAFTRPICADDQFDALIHALETKTKRPTIFMAVDKSCADALVKRGYSCNEMGPEYFINIQNYEIKGKEMKYLRWAANLGARGFEVKEQSWHEVDEELVHKISLDWRHTKAVKTRELKLITRPPEFKDTWKVRKFFCYYHGELVGYVFFDPFFEDGEIVGYTANILRGRHDIKPNGFLDYTILEAMKIFKAEGIQTLSLGLTPLHDLKVHTNEISWIRHMQNIMYKHCSFIYSFQALAYHKTRYRPQSSTWYQCVPPDASPVKAAITTLIATNVF